MIVFHHVAVPQLENMPWSSIPTAFAVGFFLLPCLSGIWHPAGINSKVSEQKPSLNGGQQRRTSVSLSSPTLRPEQIGSHLAVLHLTTTDHI